MAPIRVLIAKTGQNLKQNLLLYVVLSKIAINEGARETHNRTQTFCKGLEFLGFDTRVIFLPSTDQAAARFESVTAG